MRRIRSLWRATSAAEGGFALLELAVAMLILGMVTAGIMGMFDSLQRSEAFVRDRSQTLDRMRGAVAAMTKETRQATEIVSGSGGLRLELDTYVLGQTRRVIYEVSGGRLTRKLGSNPAVTLVAGVENDAASPLFAYTSPTASVTDAVVVAIRLKVRPERRPDASLALTSEVRLRNRGGS